MPTYVYENCLTGQLEERVCPVAERDNVQTHLRRVCVPSSVGYANATHLREPGADVAVPKAFRDLELSGKSVKQIERGTGFSRDAIRRIWRF